MIDIAWSQFFIIALLAVILLGPKDLPLVLRTLGKWFVILRSHLMDLQDYFKAVSMVDMPPTSGSSSEKEIKEKLEEPLRGRKDHE